MITAIFFFPLRQLILPQNKVQLSDGDTRCDTTTTKVGRGVHLLPTLFRVCSGQEDFWNGPISASTFDMKKAP